MYIDDENDVKPQDWDEREFNITEEDLRYFEKVDILRPQTDSSGEVLYEINPYYLEVQNHLDCHRNQNYKPFVPRKIPNP